MDYESFSVQQFVTTLRINPDRQVQRVLAQGSMGAARRMEDALKRLTLSAMSGHSVLGPLKSVAVREDFLTEQWSVSGIFYGIVNPPKWSRKALEHLINLPRWGEPMPTVFHVVKETKPRSYTP